MGLTLVLARICFSSAFCEGYLQLLLPKHLNIGEKLLYSDVRVLMQRGMYYSKWFVRDAVYRQGVNAQRWASAHSTWNDLLYTTRYLISSTDGAASCYCERLWSFGTTFAISFSLKNDISMKQHYGKLLNFLGKLHEILRTFLRKLIETLICIELWVYLTQNWQKILRCCWDNF